MNSSGRRKQEASGPRDRRAHRSLEKDRDVQLSKALSYALRHGALKLGLPMWADGFVSLGALLQLPQFRSFSAEDVQRVVDGNGKQRFALHPGDPSTGPLIRANQGMRPNCEVAVFINGPLALADGIPFFRSANGVILTPGNADGFLLPKYFKEALQLRPTRKPLSLSDNEETECQSGPRHTSRGRTMIRQ
ncbi:tRNA 2'-phosphotransferase 1 isoform X4 [Pteropus vampyrus]|uniref:2'-phosphotransferase n=1 Tax=Pteropus vampyrus TaxID=132908 RepID=A0A6P6CW80_PTEVA|nr:tRNA 2'-phosphotransferase 1 isoform X4 [Pteropus vampyrus]